MSFSQQENQPIAVVEALHHPEQQAQVQMPQLTASQTQQPPTGQLSGASALLAKKVSSKSSFYSPTDSMLSPCSSKLFDAKKRHHTKGKPLSLHNSFAAVQMQKPSALSTQMDPQENTSPAETTDIAQS